MKLTRADRSRLAEWWFTVDHVLLTAFFALVGIGLVLSLAASPAVAIKKGLSTYHFVERHAVFALLSALVLVAVSLLSPQGIRRLALGLTLAALAAMTVVILTGQQINGARRWLSFAGYSLQPSEFAKPGFIVLMAWLFSEAASRKDVPALPLAILLWAVSRRCSFCNLTSVRPC